MASGGLEIRSHVLGPARGFMSAAAPVGGPREHDGIGRTVVNMRKVRERRRGIGEKAQGYPSGHEMEFGTVVWIVGGSGAANDLIGGFGLAEVEQLAGERAARAPPCIGVLNLQKLGRDRQHQLGRRGDAITSQKKLNPA
jgi:hypothetical protein